MADEPNVPTHRWYQQRYHIPLAKEDVSASTIYDSGIQKIDAYIASLTPGPTNTVAPVISGTATVGQTLSSTTGTWTGEGAITYAYQWLDDGAEISGATSSTYTLTAGEEGGNITCRVTATDDNGSTAATSNSLGPVAAATGAPLSLLFNTDTYSDGTNTAFGDIFTTTATGLSTMVDSDGTVKWRPHNLITASNWASGWSYVDVTKGGSPVSGPLGTGTAYQFSITTADTSFKAVYIAPAVSMTATKTLGVVVSGVSGFTHVLLSNDAGTQGVWFNVATGTKGTEQTDATGSITDLGGGAYYIEVTRTATSGQFALFFSDRENLTWGTAATGTETVVLEAPRMFRSDLGGMVDNPDRSDSYVPTTSAAVYQARRNHHEYSGTSWVNKGLLLETDSATNQVEYSSNLTGGTYWLNTGGSRASGVSITNPTGSTVSTFTVGSAANNIRLYTQSPRTPTTVTTFSFLAKAKGGISWIKSRIDISGSFDGAYFDLSTGSVGTTDAGVTARIEDFGGGWYLCSTTVSAAADQFAGLSLAAGDGDVDLSAYGGSTADGVYLTMLQWEDANYHSSYIPTSGSTVTRASEALEVKAASVPWSTTAMSFVFKGEASWVTGERHGLVAGYANANNGVSLYIDADNSLRGWNNNAGTSEISIGGFLTAGYRTSISGGLRVTTTEIQAVLNGTAGANETATMSGIYDFATNNEPLQFGIPRTGAIKFNGTIASVEMWDSDIGASELETETA